MTLCTRPVTPTAPGRWPEIPREGRTWELNQCRDRRAQPPAHADADCVRRDFKQPEPRQPSRSVHHATVGSADREAGPAGAARPGAAGAGAGSALAGTSMASSLDGSQVRSPVSLPANTWTGAAFALGDSVAACESIGPILLAGRLPARTLRAALRMPAIACASRECGIPPSGRPALHHSYWTRISRTAQTFSAPAPCARTSRGMGTRLSVLPRNRRPDGGRRSPDGRRKPRDACR